MYLAVLVCLKLLLVSGIAAVNETAVETTTATIMKTTTTKNLCEKGISYEGIDYSNTTITIKFTTTTSQCNVTAIHLILRDASKSTKSLNYTLPNPCENGQCLVPVKNENLTCPRYWVNFIPEYEGRNQSEVSTNELLIWKSIKNLRVSGKGSDYIRLTWKLPVCGTRSSNPRYNITLKSNSQVFANLSQNCSDVKFDADSAEFVISNETCPKISLKSCTKYDILINEVTGSKQTGTPEVHNYSVTTLPDRHNGIVQNLELKSGSSRGLTLTWNKPICPLQISRWEIIIPEAPEAQKSLGSLEVNLDHLRPCTTYRIGVLPVYEPEVKPEKPETSPLVKWINTSTPLNFTRVRQLDLEDNSINIKLYDESYSGICDNLDISVVDKDIRVPVNGDNATIEKLDSCTTYNISIKSGTETQYFEMRTKDSYPKSSIKDLRYERNDTQLIVSWNFEDNSCFKEFVVQLQQGENYGDQVVWKNIGELMRVNETNVSILTSPTYLYKIRIDIVTRSGDNTTIGEWFPLFSESLDAATAALIAVSCLLVVVIVVAVVVIFKPKFANRRRLKSARSLLPAVVATTARRSRPIKLINIPKITTLLSAMRNQEMENEYQELKLFSTNSKSMRIGQAVENRPKNRYFNVVPYDDTRVKLSSISDIPYSDYINASYVDGFNYEEEYIAAQGPMENTRIDFWRMIWEQDVSIIIMLTTLEERGQVKCAMYWPEAKTCKKFGFAKIENVAEIHCEDWILRELKFMNGQTTRTIWQFHYLEWPDFGCPENPSGFLNFVRDVRVKINSVANRKHVLVHCSAGVGRTGTFISVDILTQQACMSPVIDIFETVLKLRSFRPMMVQNDEQYAFIYQSMADFVQNKLNQQQCEDDSDCVILLNSDLS